MSQDVRLGLIGVGGWGNVTCKALQALPAARVMGCCDPDPEARAKWAEAFGCAGYASPDELLARDDLDAVLNVTPNHLHAPLTIAAARKGLHVYVVKPMANTTDECLAMIHAAREHNVTLFVGHQMRRYLRFRKMKELIEQGAIGQPVMAEANFSHAGGMSLTPQRWRADRAKCPGLPMNVLGVHAMDTLHYLLGPIVEAFAAFTHGAVPVEADDVTQGLVRFASGVSGYIGAAYCIPGVLYVHVFGTGGNLFTGRGEEVLYQPAGQEERKAIPCGHIDAIQAELDEFLACCRGEREPETGAAEGFAAVAVLEAMIQANEHRRPFPVRQLEQALA